MTTQPWIPTSIVESFKINLFVFYVCGFWMFLPPVIVCSAIYLLCIKFAVTAPIVLLYLAWYCYSKDWPECGSMRSEWFRRNNVFIRGGGEYFNFRIVKTEELPTDRNYLAGSHPHGVLCLGLVLCYAAQPSLADLYGLSGWAVTLAGQFQWPLRRELLMWGGVGIPSKRNFQWIFGQETKGQGCLVVIGGLNEAIMTIPGKYRLKLKDRKGFVRIALTEGADLVPVYHFGENETYQPVTGICAKRLRNMQAHIINRFGFCPPLHMGESLFGLPWGGIVPRKTRIESVVGGAIRVEKNPNPTQEEVDLLHAAYCDKLIALFESHKCNYGIPVEEKLMLY